MRGCQQCTWSTRMRLLVQHWIFFLQILTTVEFTVEQQFRYVGFVVLPLYKPCCWQKWFSTMSELILEGTTYLRGNLFKCITHISLKVRSIFSISSKHFGEISFLTVLTPVVFNCAISFFQPWNQSNASFSILIRQSDKDVTGRESRNTEIIREVCLSNCIEELDENRR